MAQANLTIKLEDEAYEFFLETRVFHCQAIGCKHHIVNYDNRGSHATCELKHVYINKTGGCEQFEIGEAEADGRPEQA